MSRRTKPRAPVAVTDSVIRIVRGERVILDADLARIYGVETKALNRALKRNARKFPSDFLFRLTPAEEKILRCQIGTSSGSHGGRRYRPFAFTEHGAIMAANILNSPQAVQMSVFVVRAFIKMRAALTDTRELAQKLTALEQELTGRLDTHESAIVDVLQRIMALLDPPPAPLDEPPTKKEMGFHAAMKSAGRKT
ncbi:ORF6N domain-containing protein [Horticoccus sp. 23ND18S-11]|uniref:ORF6N domain-containing protein n=1 Tax=Horticoccus sp. 23ND18S-11 TaxID=3391832 RepID=UPI0039C9F17D